VSCAQHFGQPSGCLRICAFRDCLSIFASLQPKLPEITQNYGNKSKTEPRIARFSSDQLQGSRFGCIANKLIYRSRESRSRRRRPKKFAIR
jgi:hypothetical protein